MTKKTEVVSWEEELAAQAKALAQTERVSVSKLSFRNGILSHMDNPMPNNELACIVLAAVHEQVLYESAWDPDVISPPSCFALSTDGIGMEPHEAVQEPKGEVCASCDMFQWDSAPNGKGGKACKSRRRLAVIPAVDTPEAVKDAEMAVASIPVMSVKNWSNYVNRVAAQFQRPPWGIITRLKLVPDKKSQFKVTFEAVGSLDQDFLAQVAPRIDGARNVLLAPYEMEAAEAPPAKAGGKEKF